MFITVYRDDDKKLINNPPSSCKDINTIGHTLNGIYLVKDLNKASKIKALYCDFQSRAHIPSSSTSKNFISIISQLYFHKYFNAAFISVQVFDNI